MGSENIQKNDKNVPLNPCGRTGIEGRGLLGKWGPNHAADPVITRYSPSTGDLEVLLILRDNNEWGIPGGMVDPTEIKKIKWIEWNDSRMNNLYASHTDFMNKALNQISTKHI